jgi:hypothetical protein
MTLDLRNELESATSGLKPTSDLISRARVAGRRRLIVRRSRNLVGGVAAVALLGVGIANLQSMPGTTTVTPGTSASPEQALAWVSLPDPAPGFPYRLQPDAAPRLATVEGTQSWSRSFSLAAKPESKASDGTGVANGPEAVIMVGTFPMPGTADAIAGHPISERPTVAGTTGAVIKFEQSPGNPVTALYFHSGDFTVAMTGLYGATTVQLVALGNAIEGMDAASAISAATHKAEAQQRCQAARVLQPTGTEILFVSATTVGAVRTHTGGPGAVALAAEPWTSLKASDTAAWCTLKTGDTYKIIAATERGASITFVTSNQPLGDPGPDGPAIP